jgi:hypothetical protein
MVSRCFILCAAIALLSGSAFGDGISISYGLSQVGNTGNTYIYTYSVTNNGPTATQIDLDIYFDPSLYQQSSLTILTPNPCTGNCTPSLSWSQEILDSVNPPATYQDFAAFDAESPAGGIPVGNTVSGFEVEFTWLGATGTLPGIQPFDVYEPPSYSQPIQADSMTRNIAAAPEPATLFYMFGILFVCVVWTVSRKLLYSLREGNIPSLECAKSKLNLSPAATRSNPND